ncbi:hypothetical protein [Nocardioides sp. ChNu-99]|uniref:hypothetical protein n=1 Tax=Nocardioides sp. ChNu-99 TaxID=2839897 RepID=UPI00240626D3|nr:hypothetical protein [Nocardioides sp. ChNu-99]MDF9716463.1 hypothetical protein [Nocardioides sp. ChNu-99]
MENPIEGLAPDFSIFGAEFTQLWQKLFLAVWALCILVAIFYLVMGIARSSTAQTTGHPTQVSEARAQAKTAGIALVGLAAIVPIVGAILFVVG